MSGCFLCVGTAVGKNENLICVVFAQLTIKLEHAKWVAQ